MTLYASWIEFADRTSDLIIHLRAFATTKGAAALSAPYALEEESLLEGLVSKAWQSWGLFAREYVVKSCMGTTDGNGAAVAAHPSALTEEHVSQASVLAKGKNSAGPYWAGQNFVLRYEPTWGDADVLVRMAPRLAHANQALFVAAVSSYAQRAKVLQAIRNASAHVNIETMGLVLTFRSQYVSFPIAHPVQALYWHDPNVQDFLFAAVLDELVELALTAIS